MFGHTNEPVTLERDVRAIIIPVGDELLLRQGTVGFITQSLGGSFTVYVEGNLFRIAGALIMHATFAPMACLVRLS